MAAVVADVVLAQVFNLALADADEAAPALLEVCRVVGEDQRARRFALDFQGQDRVEHGLMGEHDQVHPVNFGRRVQQQAVPATLDEFGGRALVDGLLARRENLQPEGAFVVGPDVEEVVQFVH